MTAAAPPQGIANHKSAVTAAEAHRYLVLDGMRGVAAFAVILDHVTSATLQHFFPGRYLAVDFFFVLSGFVLAHAYDDRLKSGLSVFSFMRIRLIRLYPLYLLGLFIGLIVPIIGAWRGWGLAPMNEIPLVAAFCLFFLPAPPFHGWQGSHLYPFNGPSWSLFFELVANFVYSLIARFLSWTVFAIALPLLAVAVAFTVTKNTDLGPGWLWPHFDAGLARVLYCFFAGVFVYRLGKVIKLPALPAWLAVVLLLAIFMVPAAGDLRRPYDAFAAIILMPLLVAFSSGAKVSGKVASACGALGLLSYGVYVLHVPLMVLTKLVMDTVHIDLPYGFLDVIEMIVIAGVAAALATKFYDAPVRRWLTGRAKRAKPQLSAGEVG